jgi:hypothetical protein
MFFLQALVNANSEWVQRAGARWNKAALDLNNGTYDTKALMRDVFKSVVADPFDWALDVARESEATRILIDATAGAATAKSTFIPVKNPKQTTFTGFSRLSGSEQITGANVRLDKPPDPFVAGGVPEGMVQIVLLGLNAGAHPPGVYLGFLIEDNLPLATVIALR